MSALRIFVLRALLSALFAFLICRVFFQASQPGTVAGLGAILLGAAYLFEYVRKRERGRGHGS